MFCSLYHCSVVIDLSSLKEPEYHERAKELANLYPKVVEDDSLKNLSFPVTRKDAYNVHTPREVNSRYASCDKCTIRSPHLESIADEKKHSMTCSKLLFPAPSEAEEVSKNAKEFMKEFPFEKLQENYFIEKAADCDVSANKYTVSM